MSMHDVYLLASLLRSSGDRVLSGESKLRLTPLLLHKLNTCFSQIATQDTGPDFHVIPAHGSQLTQLSELDFLHDFVQKTPGLTVAGVMVEDGSPRHRGTPEQRRHRKNSNDGSVLDLYRFRQLHHLEVRGGTVESVAGVSALRGHIRTLMLIRMGERDNSRDDLLRTVLAGCMHTSTDAHKDAWWPSLTQLVACYCRLQTLGPCLSLAPRLVVLDLSHNFLADESTLASQLGVLLNLRYLNLSFNRLTCIPELRPELQYLVISHNRISYIHNVDNLTGLLELNLVMNHLTDHSQLRELRKMPSLHRLYLAGNPLCFHSEHRLRTCANLPRHSAQVKFLLDGTPFSKREKEEILSRKDNFIPTVSAQVSSPESSLLDSQRSYSQSFAQQGSSSQGAKRHRRVNNVVITNVEDIKHESFSRSIDASKKTTEKSVERSSVTSSQRQTPRFETSTPKASPPVISYAAQMMEERLRKMDPVKPAPPPPPVVRTVVPSTSSQKFPPPARASTPVKAPTDTSTSETADSSTYETANESSTTILVSTTGSPETTQVASETVTASQSVEVSEEESEVDSDDEDAELRTYVTQLVDADLNNPQEVFLTISSRYIKELETDNLKVRERWPLAALLGCMSNAENQLKLSFKSGNSAVENSRTYVMEDLTAVKEVKGRLSKIIDARNEAAVNQMKVIHCMQCSAVFTQELIEENAWASSAIPQDPLKAVNRCPVCKSNVLIQADEKVLPDAPKATTEIQKAEIAIEQSLEHSASDSSIGSAISLDSCSDPIAHISDSASNQPASVRRCESDIDIISNPSQSSIEVLEDSNRSTPGRKKSSEERQVVAVPSLLPVPESNLPLAGLTESSSSGSMTDSVCTAYENGAAATSTRRPAGPNLLANNVLQEEPSRESSPMANREPEGDPFNAMLNGLLKMVGNDAPSSQKTVRTDLLEENIHYDYENLASVDHRLKLHLYLSLLEEMEELIFILRTEIFTRNNSSHYEGFFVVSSKKVYLLKITGPEDRDRMASWLSRASAIDRSKVKLMTPLPWMTGVRLQLIDNTDIIFMLRDDNRTRNLLKFSKDCGLPIEENIREDDAIAASSAINTVYDQVESDVQNDMHHIENTVYVCSIAIIDKEGEKRNEWDSGALHVGLNWIVLTDDSVWCLVKTGQAADPLKLRHFQPMTNLMKVTTNRCRLSLQFMDETLGQQETWQLFATTEHVLADVISSLQLVWEPLFSVPLQVSKEQDDR